MEECDFNQFSTPGHDGGRLACRTQMILRISTQGKIRYINSSFAAYLGSTVEELTGQSFEIAKQFSCQSVADCMDLTTASLAAAGPITDAAGRVFEPLVSLDTGVLDVILTEVPPDVGSYDSFSSISPTSLTGLGENEFQNFSNPEKADISIVAVRIHSLDALAHNQSRYDIRILLDAIEEEFIRSIASNSGAIVGAGLGCFLGIFGMPQRFQDHALRAVLGATELQTALVRLAALFAEDGKFFPKLGLGIWTGEALMGALGSQRLRAYSAIGTPVQTALELSNLSQEGEILLGEPTLAGIMAHPPDGWMFQSVEAETAPDLSNFQWHGSTILPLSEELTRLRCEMVPADSPDAPAYFTFEYLWKLLPVGAKESVPVSRILQGGQASSVISLQESPGEVQGHALGRYNLLEVLGVGGMGQVWLAKDRFGHPVAIKILHAQGTPSVEALKRFRREGEIMAKLHHRSICRIHEMNEVDGISFIAMEYVRGISLSDLLSSLPESTAQKRSTKIGDSELTDLIRTAQSKQSVQTEQVHTGESKLDHLARSHVPLPVKHALSLFIKICEAVQFAHEQGVLHRDLKPANILLREDGEPLVADFGLAKLVEGDVEASISVTGNVIGTIQNMAPEQADSSKYVDERADIYSLGSILYRMLTGHPHFVTTNNIVVDGPRLQEHEPIRPRIHNPTIDVDLETIVLKCLRSNPLRRYRRVHALWEDLDRFRRGEPIAARPISLGEVVYKLVRRHKAISALCAIFLAVFGCGTVAAFWQISQRAQSAQAATGEAEEQRQLALRSKQVAEDEQALAERREGEARESTKLAQTREKETQEAITALRKSEIEIKKSVQLRLFAENATKQSEQQRRIARGEKKNELSEPKLTLHEQYLRHGVSVQNEAEYYRKKVESALYSLLIPLQVNNPLIIWGETSRQNNGGFLDPSFASKLAHTTQVLTLYTLSDPERGLPLLLSFQLSIFDVDGAIFTADSMKQRGMTPEFQVNPDATINEIRFETKALDSRFLQIRALLLRCVQIKTILPLPAATITKMLYSNGLQRSEVLTAAYLGNWNADAVVDFHRSDAVGGVFVIAAGKDVVNIAPIFDWNTNIKSLDLSYSRLSLLPPWNALGLERLIAHHSALRGFEEKGGTIKGNLDFVKELDISYSQFTSFKQIHKFLFLNKLSATGIPVKDAAELFTSEAIRSYLLKELNIANVPISSFSGISQFENLSILRFSPELLKDKASIDELRKMKLAIISTPQDQFNQEATMFWIKWDRGEYSQAPESSPSQLQKDEVKASAPTPTPHKNAIWTGPEAPTDEENIPSIMPESQQEAYELPKAAGFYLSWPDSKKSDD